MKMLFKIVIIAAFGLLQTLDASIEIRHATISDLDKIIALDLDVSMEFFKPMYENCYHDTTMGQQAEQSLKNEVYCDANIFKNAITAHDNKQKLIIASDTTTTKYCGLILGEKTNDTTMEIALLLVAKDYRNQGVGKKLIRTALSAFDGITRCQVYPFKQNNKATLAFYEKVGFQKIGDAPADRKNSYGISFDKLYFQYVLDSDGIQTLLREN
ncbi:MAG: GNAT family N-acetyltransferase [Candidatus Babeliales bacterium]|jgi:ribosomal protein S18 acetylase RimI-like enzyme